MSDNNVIVIEVFGSITQEQYRKDDSTLYDAIYDGIETLVEDNILGDGDTIITGMTHSKKNNQEVTYEIMDAIDELDLDVDVDAFFYDEEKVAEEDDISTDEAWKRIINWRNGKLFSPDDDDQRQATHAVRFGDAGSNGEFMLEHARQKSVLAIDLNLDQHVNRDQAYSDDEAKADAEVDATDPDAADSDADADSGAEAATAD